MAQQDPDNFGIEMGPRQDPRERQKIRQNYRQFLDNLKDRKEELVQPETDELHEKLEEAEALFRPVVHVREGVYDSQAMSLIASLGRTKAQNLHTEFVRFQPMEFAEKLKTFLGGQGINAEDSNISTLGWCKLGEAAQTLYKRSPPFNSIAGSIERDPKAVKVRQARNPREKDNEVGKETVPRQLDSFKGNDMNEATTEEVERVLDILKRTYITEGENPLCFFEFVLDPMSFGKTVENIFHVSFLVRDGLASVFLDEDRLPVIKPEVPNESQNLQQVQKNKQAVMSLTPDEWRDLVDTFKVEEATIPQRSKR